MNDVEYQVFKGKSHEKPLRLGTVGGRERAVDLMYWMYARTPGDYFIRDSDTNEITAQCSNSLRCRSGELRARRIQTQTERAKVRVRRLNQSRTQPLRQLLARRMSAIIDSCNDAVIVKTLDAIIAAWNPAAESIYGYLAEEVIGKHIGLLFPPENGEELAAVMEKLRNGERIEHYETVRVRKDGARIDVSVTISPITGPGGKILGASVIARDITERKKAQERIKYLAAHDSLTGLANYGTLMDALQMELRRSDRTGRPFSVLLLDLDDLKAVNDRFGHLVGSRALCRIASILQSHCRTIDTAARYGGDEFAVVLVETAKLEALQAARRVTEQLASDGEEPQLSVSIGVSTYAEDGCTVEALLAAADRALYGRKSRIIRSECDFQVSLAPQPATGHTQCQGLKP